MSLTEGGRRSYNAGMPPGRRRPSATQAMLGYISAYWTSQLVLVAARLGIAISDPGGDPGTAHWERLLQTEAQSLGVTLQSYRVGDPEELDDAFAAMTKARAEALLVVPSPFFAYHNKRIVDLAARHRLPAMYPDRPNVDDGGLMAYAVDELEAARRLAAYVDRILKGANPGDLPVEQPTGFKLILNLKTAKTLGLTIPPTFLLQVDEVIR